MDIKKLANILELHKKWLNAEKDGVRANLRGANLRGANLSGADLSCADLSGANLRNADLRNANLRDADLSYADLSDANLRDADFSYADLSDANLSDAHLSDANLRNADLRNANLKNANLRDADLDFASIPLSCSLTKLKVDNRLPFQLAYHICSFKSDDKEVIEIQEFLKEFANKSHLIKDHDLEEFKVKKTKRTTKKVVKTKKK